MIFLAGAQENPRSRVYICESDAGEVTDYWAGMPVIENADQLDDYLRANPRAWLVIDEEWLEINDRYDVRMAAVVRELAEPVRSTDGEGLVLRVIPD